MLSAWTHKCSGISSPDASHRDRISMGQGLGPTFGNLEKVWQTHAVCNSNQLRVGVHLNLGRAIINLFARRAETDFGCWQGRTVLITSKCVTIVAWPNTNVQLFVLSWGLALGPYLFHHNIHTWRTANSMYGAQQDRDMTQNYQIPNIPHPG